MAKRDIQSTGPLTYRDLQQLNDLGFTNTSDEGYKQWAKQNIPEVSNNRPFNPGFKLEPGKAYSQHDLTSYLNDKGANQSFLSHVLNGLGQNLITAGTAMGELILTPFTFGADLAGKLHGDDSHGLWGNKVTEIAHDILDWSNEHLPNYRVEGDAWYNDIGSELQTFLQTLGYTEGFIGGALLGGAGIRGLGSLTKLAKSGKGLMSFLNGVTKSGAVTKAITGSLLSSYAEAEDQTYADIKDKKDNYNRELDNEYDDNYQQLLQQYAANQGREFVDVDGELVDKAYLDFTQGVEQLQQNTETNKQNGEYAYNQMGDKVFLANFGLLALTNMLEFGHLFSGGFRTAKRGFRLLEKSGEFSAPVKMLRAKAIGKAGLNALSEGFQEKAQGSFTTVAGEKYDAALKKYKNADTDEEAFDSVMNGWETLTEGLLHALTTTENMEDAVMGAITALVGVPMITKGANRQAYLGRNKFFGISGGLASELKEANEQIRTARQGAEYMNNFYQNKDTNANILRNLVRYQKFANDMNEAAIMNDKYEYENGKASATMEMINMFDNAGKLNDLTEIVSTLANEELSEEDINDIVESTTKTITNEQGEQVNQGPYWKDEKTRFSDDEIREKVKENAEDFKSFINTYNKIKNDLDTRTSEEATNEQLQEMTWLTGQLNNLRKRQGEINQSLAPVINSVSNALRRESKTEEANDVLSLLMDIDPIIKFDFEHAYKVLKENLNKEGVLTDTNTIRDIDDAIKINKFSKRLTDLWNEVTKEPVKDKSKLTPKNDINKIKEKVINRKLNKKTKQVNNTETFYDFKQALDNSNLTDEEKETYLNNTDKKDFANQYKDFKQFEDYVKEHLRDFNIENADGVDIENINEEAEELLQEHIDNAKDINELKDPNSRTITDSSASDLAKMKVQQAIQNTINSKYEAEEQRKQQLKSKEVKSDNTQKQPDTVTTDVVQQTEIENKEIERLQQEEKAKSNNLTSSDEIDNIDNSILDTFYMRRIGKKKILSSDDLKKDGVLSDKYKDNFLNKIPGDTIPADIMRDILTDLYYACGESFTNVLDELNKQLPSHGAVEDTQVNKEFWNKVKQLKDEVKELIKDNVKKQNFLDSVSAEKDVNVTEFFNKENPQHTKDYYEPAVNEYHQNAFVLHRKPVKMFEDTAEHKEKLKEENEAYHKHLKNVYKQKGKELNTPEDNNESTETNYEAIYKYLEKNNAFRNISKLKVGDRIRFMVDDNFEFPNTIFMINDKNEVVGSLREYKEYNFYGTTEKYGNYNGLKALQENIRQWATEQRNKSAIKGRHIYQTISEDKVAKPIASVKVNDKFNGFLLYGNVEHTLSNMNNMDNQNNLMYVRNGKLYDKKGEIYESTFDKFHLPKGTKNMLQRFNGMAVYILPVGINRDGNVIHNIIPLKRNRVTFNDFGIDENGNPTHAVDENSIPGKIKKIFSDYLTHLDNVNSGKETQLNTKPFNVKLKELIMNPSSVRKENGKLADAFGISFQRTSDGVFKPYIFSNRVPFTFTGDKETIIDQMCKILCKTRNNNFDQNNGLYYNVTKESLKNKDIFNHVTTNLVDTNEHSATFTTNYLTVENGKFVEVETENTSESVAQENPNVQTSPTIATEIPTNNENKTIDVENEIQDMTSTLDDVDFRLVPEDTNFEYKQFDKQKELRWLNKNLPQLSSAERLRFVDGLIKVMNKGADAYGKYSNGIITISDKAATGTVYHEAFHAVLDLYFTENEKQNLFKDARKYYNDENINDYDLEEKLAEDFREYTETKQNRNLPQRILDFFKQLLSKITNWNQNKSTVDKLFKEINQGKYNANIYNVQSVKERNWNNIPKENKNSLLESGWTEEEFNSLTQDEMETALKCHI